MDLELSGKVALVTGGSRGIGRAICLALAAEGVKVAVNYRVNAELAERVVTEIRDGVGGEAAAFGADLASEAAICGMFDAVEAGLGPVDILVNNAAHCPTGPIASYTREEWDYTFAVNVGGAFVASREHVERLKAAGRRGRIVNIASQAAFRGSESGHLPYDSSKGALVSFTIGLAREVAPLGINVNAVAPGMVLTEMVEEKWERNKARYLQRIPMRRIGETREIANVVVFLASAAASYMTGATVDVSGGMLMR